MESPRGRRTTSPATFPTATSPDPTAMSPDPTATSSNPSHHPSTTMPPPSYLSPPSTDNPTPSFPFFPQVCEKTCALHVPRTLRPPPIPATPSHHHRPPPFPPSMPMTPPPVTRGQPPPPPSCTILAHLHLLPPTLYPTPSALCRPSRALCLTYDLKFRRLHLRQTLFKKSEVARGGAHGQEASDILSGGARDAQIPLIGVSLGQVR